MEVQRASAGKGSTLMPIVGLASAVAMGVFIGYGLSRPAAFSSASQSESESQSHVYRRSVIRERTDVNNDNDNIINNNINRNLSENQIAKLIRTRIFKTYGYLFASVGITSVSSYLIFNYTNTSHRMAMQMSKHPIMFLIGSLIPSIGLLIGCRITDYQRRPVLKHILWVLMHLNEGAFLSVLGFVGGSLITKAMIYSAFVLCGISCMSASAPNSAVLKLGSFLGIGLGFLCGMSCIALLYPSANSSALYQNTQMYGGLVLFALQMAYDTKKVLLNAQNIYQRFDPINQQMDLYLNSVNFFMKMLQLLMKLQNEKNQRKKRNDDDEDQ